MATLLDFFLFLGVLAAWTVALRLLDRGGYLKKWNLVPVGFFLMVKTRRGRGFIDRAARFGRAWRVFGDISIALVALAMVGITALLIWEAILIRNIPPDRAPSPETLLGIPGLNPIIPLGYGVFALAIAVGIHEFLHGILARVSKVKIESLGVLFAILPIGAFVEPAEAEMKALPRRERARIYSVGAGINLVLALLFGALFSTMMLSVQPAAPGVGVYAYSSAASPALAASPGPIPIGSIITHLNANPTPTPEALRGALDLAGPGANVSVTAWKDGGAATYTATLGDDGTGRAILGIYIFDTSPAYYHPFTDLDRFGGVPGSILLYVSLPFLVPSRAPLQGPVTDFYTVTGPWAAIPAPLFYVIANTLYWLFWLNLMLGATNALPAVPLDGGFVFKDGLESLIMRLRRGLPAERRDRIVRVVSYSFALLILALILWQLIGPRLRF